VFTPTATPSGGGGNGNLLWADAYGGVGEDRGQSVAVDAQGELFMTGYFSDTVDFGGGPLTAFKLPTQTILPTDVFLAKYSPAGVHRWSKQFGAQSDDKATGVAVDAEGNVVMAGSFANSVSFGGEPLSSVGGWDIFLAKCSGADGGHLWSRSFGSAAHESSTYRLTADPERNVIVTGSFSNPIDFGGGPLGVVTGPDIFLAKYAGGDGAHLWSRAIGGTGADFGHAVATDAMGNVVVVGEFGATVDFGGGPLTSAGLSDIFVAKYSPSGAHLWSQRFGSTSSDNAKGVAVDSLGNVIVTGQFVGTVGFGGASLQSAGSTDVFVAKYSPSGVHLWSRRGGGSQGDGGDAVGLDGADNVVVAGVFKGSGAGFGGQPFTSAGSSDVFAAKYAAADGAHLWSRSFPGTGDDRVSAAALDNAGHSVLTGYFAATIDFGQGPLTSTGLIDIFSLCLEP
jgi:hypothetical protein